MPRGYRTRKRAPEVKEIRLEDKKIELYGNTSDFTDELLALSDFFEVLFYAPFLILITGLSFIFDTVTLPYAITKNMIINSKIKKEARTNSKNDVSYSFSKRVNDSKDKSITKDKQKKYSKVKTFSKSKDKDFRQDL